MFRSTVQLLLPVSLALIAIVCKCVTGQLSFTLPLEDGQQTPFNVSLTSPPLLARFTALDGDSTAFTTQDSFFSFPGVVLANSFGAATLSIAFTPALTSLSFLFAAFSDGDVRVRLRLRGTPVGDLSFTPTLVQDTQTYEGAANITLSLPASFDQILISDVQAVNFAAGGTIRGVEVPPPLPSSSSSTGRAAAALGDPLLIGLRGQSFQVHGIDGATYSLISDSYMQINARFAFLDGPRRCPNMPSTHRPSAACWSHPGSYLSHIYIALAQPESKGGRPHQLLIAPGDAMTGFDLVNINGRTINCTNASGSDSVSGCVITIDIGNDSNHNHNSSSDSRTASVHLLSSHELSITAGHWHVEVESVDGFANIRHVSVSAAGWSTLRSHGLLGQTWQDKRYASKLRVIEGDVDDYIVEDDSSFSGPALHNRFFSGDAEQH